ncbi:MAG: hypothetical protein GYB31_06000 [Bacteroidetes bacterium]|nr:hypothetical protein [Bacteroidota bacterium]
MRPVVFLLMIFAVLACGNKAGKTAYYLAVAHTRICDGQPPDFPDPRLPLLRPDSFDLRLVLGDVACGTSRKEETLQLVDSVLDLSSPHTLLARGNHDVQRPDRLDAWTGRSSFYSFTHNGIVFLVLDTQLDDCNISGGQLEMVQAVADTIRESKHLVLLHHKLIWLPDHPKLEPRIKAISNIGICDKNYCLYRNNFYDQVFPLLEQLSLNGIQVLCVAGDIGKYSKTFEWEVNPNFHYLATGWGDDSPSDKWIRFRHDLQADVLSWSFESAPGR